MHLMVEWLSWLQDKHDFIKSNILKTSKEVVRAKESWVGSGVHSSSLRQRCGKQKM